MAFATKFVLSNASPSTEALVKKLPLVFFNAIPGQETKNVKVLAKYGVGQYEHSVHRIVAEVRHLKNDKDYFSQSQKNISKLASPNAAASISKLIS